MLLRATQASDGEELPKDESNTVTSHPQRFSSSWERPDETKVKTKFFQILHLLETSGQSEADEAPAKKGRRKASYDRLTFNFKFIKKTLDNLSNEFQEF